MYKWRVEFSRNMLNFDSFGVVQRQLPLAFVSLVCFYVFLWFFFFLFIYTFRGLIFSELVYIFVQGLAKACLRV